MKYLRYFESKERENLQEIIGNLYDIYQEYEDDDIGELEISLCSENLRICTPTKKDFNIYNISKNDEVIKLEFSKVLLLEEYENGTSDKKIKDLEASIDNFFEVVNKIYQVKIIRSKRSKGIYFPENDDVDTYDRFEYGPFREISIIYCEIH